MLSSSVSDPLHCDADPDSLIFMWVYHNFFCYPDPMSSFSPICIIFFCPRCVNSTLIISSRHSYMAIRNGFGNKLSYNSGLRSVPAKPAAGFPTPGFLVMNLTSLWYWTQVKLDSDTVRFMIPSRTGEPDRLKKTRSRSRSRSRLEKKSGVGAAKKLAGSSALREGKKHKKIAL